MSDKKTTENSIYAEEAGVIEDYIHNVYGKRVKPPREPEPLTRKDMSFWKLVGVEASLYGGSGIAAIIFSAFRTGTLFYVVESLLLSEFGIGSVITNTVSLALAAIGLFAFEGYLAADGFSKGKNAEDVKASKVATYMAGAVILAGGVFSSMSLISDLIVNIKIWVYLIISIVMAVAGTVIVFYSGANIGFVVLSFDKKKKALVRDFDTRYSRWDKANDAWREKAVGTFWQSRQGRAFKKGSAIVQNEHQNEQAVQEGVQDSFTAVSKLTKAEQAFNWVEAFVHTTEQIPTVSQVVEQGGFKKTMASYAINDFICDNADALISDRLVDAERAQRACASVDKRST